MANAVGAIGLQRRAGIGVHDDRGELRAVALALFVMMARSVIAMPVVARFGGAGCESDRGSSGDQSESTRAHRARGSKVCTKHKLPRPIFCLVHRFVRLNYAQRPATVFLSERPDRFRQLRWNGKSDRCSS